MQAIVGNLVAKTLSSASAGAYYGAQRVAAPPVAFDVFSVQACTNTIMAHFVGMLFRWGGRRLPAPRPGVRPAAGCHHNPTCHDFHTPPHASCTPAPCSNWILLVVNKYNKRQQEREAAFAADSAPSAPPMPGFQY